MNYKILVTGGAGYIGSVLVPELLALGNSVTVLDSFLFRQTPLLDCCSNERFSIKRGDVRNEQQMREIIKDIDIIIPLAAIVGAPLCNRDETAAVTVNRDAVRMICRIASPNQRILMPITNSGYGIGQSGAYCTEDSPLKPLSLYGRTKVEAEEAILERGNSISFRLATVFGCSPRMRLDLLVNDFTYRAVKDRFIVIFEGHFKRNYIHIRDVARTFIHGIENFEQMRGSAYNVGLSEANISKLELCAKIKQHISEFVYMESAVGEDPDKRDYLVSNEKIEATGWKPKFSLDHGIKELIKAFRYLDNAVYSNV